jgi:hypothetical protein
MIEQTINPSKGIVIVQPKSALSAEDFVVLSEAVDAYLASHQKLKGLMIYTDDFPGWEDFEGFIGHMRFVRDHHQEIEKVAIVSDAKVANTLPKLAQHFLRAEIKTFAYSAFDDAEKWLES